MANPNRATLDRTPALEGKFEPIPRPEVDIRQDFGEVVADAIGIGAGVMVYAVDPRTARSPGMTLDGSELEAATRAMGDATKNPLDTWGVCLCDIGRVVPPFDLARFATREAALAWARSRGLNLVTGGATLAGNAPPLRAA